MPDSHSERVQYLIRKCLCGGYLTVEALTDELYCSRSTIIRDLEKVKSAVMKYDLRLTSKRAKEYTFKSMFLMMGGNDNYEQIRLLLLHCLKEQSDFTLPFISFPKIINYIVLAVTRHKCASKMLILLFETQNRQLAAAPEAQPYFDETRELIGNLSERYGLADNFFDEQFVLDFSCFLYTLNNRLEFQVYHDTEALNIVQSKGVWSSDLCVDFARFYEIKHGIRLGRQDVMSVYYLFRRVTSGHATKYYEQNVLIISRYGIQYAMSLAANISESYRNEVHAVDAREFCDVEEDDFLNYDLLITDVGLDQIHYMTSHTLPALYVDYFISQNRSLPLEWYLKQLRQDHERSLLGESCLHHESLCSKTMVFEYLADQYKLVGEARRKFLCHLQENDAYLDTERENGVVFLPVVLEGENRSQITVVVNRTPFVWNQNHIKFFISYFRGRTQKENHIINDILKRFVHASPELAEDLSGCSKADFLKLLYLDAAEK